MVSPFEAFGFYKVVPNNTRIMILPHSYEMQILVELKLIAYEQRASVF